MYRYKKNSQLLIIFILIIVLSIKTDFFKNFIDISKYNFIERITNKHGFCSGESIGYLILISLIYAAVILKIGYFISTSLFLIASYYFLGERRWIWMFLLSFPFVAIFMFLLHGVLNIYLRDPFLKYLGVMG